MASNNRHRLLLRVSAVVDRSLAASVLANKV